MLCISISDNSIYVIVPQGQCTVHCTFTTVESKGVSVCTHTSECPTARPLSFTMAENDKTCACTHRDMQRAPGDDVIPFHLAFLELWLKMQCDMSADERALITKKCLLKLDIIMGAAFDHHLDDISASVESMRALMSEVKQGVFGDRSHVDSKALLTELDTTGSEKDFIDDYTIDPAGSTDPVSAIAKYIFRY